jgi:hypothetical protein
MGRQTGDEAVALEGNAGNTPAELGVFRVHIGALVLSEHDEDINVNRVHSHMPSDHIG